MWRGRRGGGGAIADQRSSVFGSRSDLKPSRTHNVGTMKLADGTPHTGQIALDSRLLCQQKQRENVVAGLTGVDPSNSTTSRQLFLHRLSGRESVRPRKQAQGNHKVL